MKLISIYAFVDNRRMRNFPTYNHATCLKFRIRSYATFRSKEIYLIKRIITTNDK